jgi:hypothetical protein
MYHHTHWKQTAFNANTTLLNITFYIFLELYFFVIKLKLGPFYLNYSEMDQSELSTFHTRYIKKLQ